MTLKLKTLVIVTSLITCFLAVLYILSQTIILNSFSSIEDKYTRNNIDRVVNIINHDLYTLDASNYDWSAWDDTYRFVTDRNERYIQSNMVDDTFIISKINIIVYLDNQGGIIYAKAYDFRKNTPMPVPDDLNSHIGPNKLLTKHSNTNSSVKVIVFIDKKPMLITSRPIITSKKEGPIKGSLIMGRYLDSAEINNFSDILQLPIKINQINNDTISVSLKSILNELNGKDSNVVAHLSKNLVAGYSIIKDIYDKPAFIVKIEMPREIYQKGKDSVAFFMISLFVVSVIIMLLMLMLLQTHIIKHLSEFCRKVMNIGGTGNLSTRIEYNYNDEFNGLANSINYMLESIGNYEKTIRDSEIRYRSTIDSITDMIFVADTNDKILICNEEFKKWLGKLEIEKGSACSKLSELFQLLPDVFKESFLQMNEKSSMIEIEATYQPKGINCTLSIRLIPVIENNCLVRIISIIRDITERKKMEEQIQIQSRMDSLVTLAGGIAHDFNNLLTSIIGSIDMIKYSGNNLNQEQQKYIEIADKSCQHAASLVKEFQLLDGESTENPECFDVFNIINDIVNLLNHTTDRLISKKINFGEGRFFVYGNETQLYDVFLNLGTNAIHAIQEKGIVYGDMIEFDAAEFHSEGMDDSEIPKGDYVLLSVRDTGIGMTEEIQKKIFDPFFTTKERTSRKGQGLGLAMVYNVITKKHNGFIKVETKYGEGSVFHIYLIKAEDKICNDRKGIMKINGNGENILVIDDEEQVTNILEKVLTIAGYSVLKAQNGQDGLDIINKKDGIIDLVLLDLNMPVMSGDTFIKKVDSIAPDIKIIISSGQSKVDRDKYTRASGFIGKPFKPQDLLEKVRYVLDDKPIK